jgi:hypothetical protein
LAVVGTLVAVPAAEAATLAVDDDHAQCPGAQFGSVQAAVNAANAGDTIAICPGRYVEGNGALGTNAVTISKSLTIKGAGADLVVIQPRRGTPTGGQIAEGSMNIRNGVGDIVSIVGQPDAPLTVDISGVTIDGNGVFAEAGVVFRDAGGSMVRDRVTNIVTSITNSSHEIPGGYRSNNFGYGIAQVTAAQEPAGGPRLLKIDHTRVDRYNKIGILIDAGSGGGLPLNPSGVVNSAVLSASQVVGRVQCRTFNTPTPPPYVLGGAGETPELDLPGNCDVVGLTTVGPTFGQDGVRVTAGSTVSVTDSLIAQNLVNGAAAPPYNSTTNNQNLSLGAGLRLIGAGPSTLTRSNVTDNAYGVFNATLDGATANNAVPLAAEQNWWGLRTNNNISNVGPAISPIRNPFYQENPVNGTGVPDGAGTTSSAVDFFPFRNGSQSDPDAGQWPVVFAPLPVADAGPSVLVTTDKKSYDQGERVAINLRAEDDFGVTKVTLFDGATPIGQVIPPARTADFTIPADALCAARTLSAVASDYLGQTASDTAEIKVVGPNECKPVVVPPPAGPPSVKLTGVPTKFGAGGAKVGADARADGRASVVRVDFFLGTRMVCADTVAPYECDVRPRGREVGAQTLRAVVIDSAGQNAANDVAVTVDRFQPSGLSTRVSTRLAGKKVKGVVSGALSLPEGVSAEEGCRSGTVSVTVKRGGRSVLPATQVPLSSECTYKLKFTARKQAKNVFQAAARFGGNAVLSPASNNRRSR